MEDWITTSEASELSGYHPDYVRKLLQSHKVDGRKWGHAWMVSYSSLLAYLKKVEERGEKRGPKKTLN